MIDDFCSTLMGDYILRNRLGAVMGVCIFSVACTAWAKPGIGAGNNMVNVGWAHYGVFQNNSPQTTTISPALGGGTSTSPGTQLSVSDANTIDVVFTHFFTDHVVAYFAGGYPAEFHATAYGTVTTKLGSVNQGQASYQPLVKSVREWDPALFVGYYFNAPDARFRPFVGVGVSYVWFTHAQLNGKFLSDQKAIVDGAAPFLAPVSITASASSSFSPIFNIGLSYRLRGRFYASASVSYNPLSTTTELDIRSASGTLLSSGRSRLNLRTVITTIGIGYKFGS